jgi:hypothetical protein
LGAILIYISGDKTSTNIPQLFLGLSTRPDTIQPTPNGTFDLALVTKTGAIELYASEVGNNKYVLKASISDMDSAGYLVVSKEEVPGLAKYRTFFFVDDPETLSYQVRSRLLLRTR